MAVLENTISDESEITTSPADKEEQEKKHLLASLDRLDQLKSLEELSKLELLEQLQSLENLKELEKLAELQSLDKLEKLEELRELSKLGQLADLEKLERLSQLKELEKLEVINKLETTLERNQSTLAPLEHLEKLLELVKLKELEKLSDLSKLESLNQLDKLDKLNKIDDARFADRLHKLDKLDILERGTRTLVIQQTIGFGFEVLKLTLAGAAIVFLLSRETGREIAAKALPALGFGSAAQVSLGLKLLVGETSPEQFQSLVVDTRRRIDAEIESVFSPSGSLTIYRRMELISQIQSYSFQNPGVDLATEAAAKLQKKSLAFNETAASRVEYEMSLARGRQDTATENSLREIKLLLIQKQYPQLIEKVIPLWGTSEAITLAAIAGTTALKLQDPGTLEEMLRKIPGSGTL